MNRLLSSPLMIFVYTFFAIAGVFIGFTLGGATFAVPLAIVLAFGFVLAVAAVEIIFRRKIAGDIETGQDFAPIQEISTNEADQVRQLQEAKQMLESGLITQETYEATVEQILTTE
jgi:hypothetical protein